MFYLRTKIQKANHNKDYSVVKTLRAAQVVLNVFKPCTISYANRSIESNLIN